MRLPAGTKVGAGRWPYIHCHPDCWEEPWSGFILEQNDVRAWANTLAFPGRTPSQEEVDVHVAWCHQEGLLPLCRVPVLWQFKDRQQVFWETVGDGQYEVKPYEDDYALWLQAKQERLYGSHTKTSPQVQLAPDGDEKFTQQEVGSFA